MFLDYDQAFALDSMQDAQILVPTDTGAQSRGHACRQPTASLHPTYQPPFPTPPPPFFPPPPPTRLPVYRQLTASRPPTYRQPAASLPPTDCQQPTANLPPAYRQPTASPSPSMAA